MHLNKRNYMTLKGHKVYLVPLDETMVDEMYGAVKDIPYDVRVLTTTKQFFRRSTIEGFIHKIQGDPSRYDFAIMSLEDDSMVGDLALNDFDYDNGICNIRIAISRVEDFSKGYGSEAMVLLMNYGFSILNLHKIELSVLDSNARGRHVYKKLGFVEEGVRRQACYYDYDYRDMVQMGILKDEFYNKHIKE